MPPLKLDEPEDNKIDENRTFFWSELIAKAYKCFGIYNSDESWTKVFPKHFSSSDNKLKLENAKLGEEVILID